MSPPIHRDGFSYYDGQFFVQLENTNHVREAAQTLYSLLTSKARKDRPIDFYRAQLLHYGLPDLKTKQAAKKKLLNAFKDGQKGEKGIEVPSAILKLEEEMKEEWTRLNEEEMRARAEEIAAETPPVDYESESGAIPAFIIETRMRFFSLEKAAAEKVLDNVLSKHWRAESDLRYEMEKLGVGNFAQYPTSYTGKRIPKTPINHLAQLRTPLKPKPVVYRSGSRTRQTARVSPSNPEIYAAYMKRSQKKRTKARVIRK